MTLVRTGDQPALKATKAMSLRLTVTMAQELALIAEVEGRTISDLVREAINRLIESFRADDDFKMRLKMKMEEEQELVRKFAR